MNFTQYEVDLMRLLTAEEQVPTDLPLNTLNQAIVMAERRIYKDARSRYNEKDFTDAIIEAVAAPVEVTNNLAPLPDDFEAPSVVHFGKKPLLPVPENFLLEYNANPRTGDAIYFAEAGNSLTFAPLVADGTAVQGRYFCRLPALSLATAEANALFQNEYDLFIYGGLLEAAPIFGLFKQLPVWEAKYQTVLDKVNKRRESAAFGSGRMQMRASAGLMR